MLNDDKTVDIFYTDTDGSSGADMAVKSESIWFSEQTKFGLLIKVLSVNIITIVVQ